jgi:3-polyprenyl-4-hydroxybenzoate decarboxylase
MAYNSLADFVQVLAQQRELKRITYPVKAELEIEIVERVMKGNSPALLFENVVGHTGFYSLADDYSVFHVTCMTYRKNPIYPTTIVGRPRMEDAYLGKTTERLFLPLVHVTLPEIVDMHLPVHSIHNLAIVSIKKEYPGHARKVMHALWGLGQMMFTKILMIVDHDVYIQDLAEVTWVVVNHIDPKRDVIFVDGPVDVLDHAVPVMALDPRWVSMPPASGAVKDSSASGPMPSGWMKKTKQYVDSIWQNSGSKFPISVCGFVLQAGTKI